MRIARVLLLILALAVGQAHACSALYLCADGAVCTTCSEALDTAINVDACSDLEATPTDCRTCCELAPCASDSQSAALTLIVQLQQPVALIEPILDIPATQSVQSVFSQSGDASQLDHGPPGDVDSRGPPSYRL